MNRDQEKKAIASGMRFYWKKIFTYIKQGDEESAKRLVERHIKENKWESKEVYGYLLAVAAERGEVDIAEFFKDQGANLDCEVYNGSTPLWLAMKYQHNKMVKALKEWGARKDTHDIFGSPSRSHCIPSPFSAWVKSTGKKEEIRDKMGLYWQEILLCIKQSDRKSAERIIEDLISRNKWESKKEVYSCLLIIAATQDEIQVAEFCKNRGADLDYVSYNGRTSLWLARESGKNQMVETLEKWGARGDTDKYCGKPFSNLITPDYRYEIEDFYYDTFYNCFKKGLSKENLAKTVENFVQNCKTKGTVLRKRTENFSCVLLLCMMSKLLSFAKIMAQILIIKAILEKHHWR